MTARAKQAALAVLADYTPLTAQGRPDGRFVKNRSTVAQGHQEAWSKRVLFPCRIDADVWALMQARQKRTKESMNAIITEFLRKGVGL